MDIIALTIHYDNITFTQQIPTLNLKKSFYLCYNNFEKRDMRRISIFILIMIFSFILVNASNLKVDIVDTNDSGKTGKCFTNNTIINEQKEQQEKQEIKNGFEGNLFRETKELNDFNNKLFLTENHISTSKETKDVKKINIFEIILIIILMCMIFYIIKEKLWKIKS